VGTVSSARLVKDGIEELYDYGALRTLDSPTLFIIRPAEPTLVLGGSQSLEVLDEQRRSNFSLRRRRGGGGLVLLQPDDVWLDWWIPASDLRWSPDVHVTSYRVGKWWSDVLTTRVSQEVEMHEGSLEGRPELRVACFAGRGPGEIFVGGRKVVGLTQWRVREGVFVSTVLHAHPSTSLLDALHDGPEGLGEALEHHTLATLDLDPDDVSVALIEESQPMIVRQLFLLP
jgi:lipoate-protein ligase A